MAVGALVVVLIVFGSVRGRSVPQTMGAKRQRELRAVVDGAATKLIAERHRYDPQQWQRVYALAWALHRHRQTGELRRSEFGNAWQPLEADEEGRELSALLE